MLVECNNSAGTNYTPQRLQAFWFVRYFSQHRNQYCKVKTGIWKWQGTNIALRKADVGKPGPVDFPPGLREHFCLQIKNLKVTQRHELSEFCAEIARSSTNLENSSFRAQ